MKKKNLIFLQTFVYILAFAFPAVARANPEEERASAEKRFLENYKTSMTNGPQTAENRLAMSAYQQAKDLCPGYKGPISELEEELQGKLFFVQTLPGLSEDGTLIATYQQKGVHFGEPRPNFRNDYVSSTGEELRGKFIIASDWKSTNHFTINH